MTWNGSTSVDWGNAANWDDESPNDKVPPSGDDVVIDGAASFQPLLALSGVTTIASLAIGQTTASTLTFDGGNVTDKKLLVTGDVTIGANGTLQHSVETAATVPETHRLFLDVVGNLTIASGGSINVDGRGYQGNWKGPGVSSLYNGASHGGQIET